MAYLLRLSAGVLRIPLEADSALSATAFGAMSSMVFYAYTLMQIPVGALADSKGVRFTVTAGMTAAGAGAFIFSLAPTPWLLFVGRILMGMGVAVAFISSVLFLADNFSGELFGTLSGITSFIGNTGGILAQAPLALMITALTWRTTFSILGAVCLALALGCYLTIPSGGGASPSQSHPWPQECGPYSVNGGYTRSVSATLPLPPAVWSSRAPGAYPG
ncbi:MAG: MFS transporter [Synergistaceae bacterium]|nr:MFS transporter [Synergistaceae bacterium]